MIDFFEGESWFVSIYFMLFNINYIFSFKNIIFFVQIYVYIYISLFFSLVFCMFLWERGVSYSDYVSFQILIDINSCSGILIIGEEVICFL